jgi:hypothetical protein
VDDVDCVEEIRLDEFDRGTTLEIMNDGSLWLHLRLMPPSWATEDDGFDSFQSELEVAIGTSVEGADKELFVIAAPTGHTVERVRTFLAAVRARHDRRQLERTR